MVMIRHPLSRTEYRRNDDGTILVSGKGKEGIFNRQGQWISGIRRTADAALCQWVADGHIPPGMALSAPVIRGSQEPAVVLPAGEHGI